MTEALDGNGIGMPLTWLYVPADRGDRIPKAFASGADVVIVDLEDAITAAHKDQARGSAATALAEPSGAAQVRINAVGTQWHHDDLHMVSQLPESVGVRIPKCDDPATVAAVAEAVGDRALHLLVESARGVEAAFELARAHERVASIGLGEADLRADLGVDDDDGLLWARSRVVNATAAAGLEPPSMSVYPDVRDLAGLAASCERGRTLGFVGRAAIHPAQLPVIRDAFSPSETEIKKARELLEAARAGEASGHGAVALPDGRFVDEAVVRQARRLLARAGLGAG